ncbi:MAG: hypothetical protein KGJ57_21265 [Sphingomonadales bacterium]|nr:hypothetical protein [Sphingomonadales bacterium]MDE2171924.1 hypothetical protein [Sphingomonadales bacterium]
MSWLKNILGGQTPNQRPTDGTNPIHAWLDAYEIPWRESRGKLIARYGITNHPDRSFEAVELNVPKPPIRGLIRPLYFQISEHFSPNAPAVEFIGDSYYVPNESTNIQSVAKELCTFLGPVNIEHHLNTIRAIWEFDNAKVRLLTWPKEKQRQLSAWGKPDTRDPRLKLGCYITIQTGFVPSASEIERSNIETFVPICSLPKKREARSHDNFYVNQGVMEFIREAENFSLPDRSIGMSADQSLMIFRDKDLYLFKMSMVRAIHVVRTKPAKGPGGSVLQVEVLTDYDGIPVKSVTVCEAAGVDDLNEIGELVASSTGKPLHLSPYYSDC